MTYEEEAKQGGENREKVSSSLYTSYFVDSTLEPGKHFK